METFVVDEVPKVIDVQKVVLKLKMENHHFASLPKPTKLHVEQVFILPKRCILD